MQRCPETRSWWAMSSAAVQVFALDVADKEEKQKLIDQETKVLMDLGKVTKGIVHYYHGDEIAFIPGGESENKTNPLGLSYAIVMEQCQHHLAQWLAETTNGGKDPLPLSLLQSVVRQLLDVYQFIHSRSVCHRDVKPLNILVADASDPLSKEPVIKLCDFETSKHLLVSGTSTTVSMNTKVGSIDKTGCWFAPEVLKTAEGTHRKNRYKIHCDLWPLGGVLHFLGTGGVPLFHADNDIASAQLVEAAGHDNTERLRHLRKAKLHEKNYVLYDLVERLVRPVEASGKGGPAREFLGHTQCACAQAAAENPLAIPSCASVQGHPFLWQMEDSIRHLKDLSSHVEEQKCGYLYSLQDVPNWNDWPTRMNTDMRRFVDETNLNGQLKPYLDDPNLRSLLSVVRNLLEHYAGGQGLFLPPRWKHDFMEALNQSFPKFLVDLWEHLRSGCAWQKGDGVVRFICPHCAAGPPRHGQRVPAGGRGKAKK
jgi:serine/threonine protein kinase